MKRKEGEERGQMEINGPCKSNSVNRRQRRRGREEEEEEINI